MTSQQRAEELAAAHWDNYNSRLLEAFGVEVRDADRFNFISAFVHGWKHALEWQQDQQRQSTYEAAMGQMMAQCEDTLGTVQQPAPSLRDRMLDAKQAKDLQYPPEYQLGRGI